LGLGLAFLQLAQLAGVECWGTASAEKRDLVTKFGGHPIDYRTEDWFRLFGRCRAALCTPFSIRLVGRTSIGRLLC